MKRTGNLYDYIYDYENMCLAYRKAVKGKHTRQEVIAFKRNFHYNLNLIRQQIKDRKPDIGHYLFFKVYDPKLRDICAASFPERILHHAIMNICEPYFESYYINDTYACRKNKGNQKAIHKAKKYCRTNKWYLKMDIKKYFDSIDHMILFDLLARRFKDKDLLNLFYKIIQTYHTTPNKGLPIGNLISQHSANYYLAKFDHWIKESLKIKGYLRYMDDFLVFDMDKQRAMENIKSIINYLDCKLALQLKPNWQLNRTKYGVSFLGYRVFPQKVLLLPYSRNRFVEKFIQYERNYIQDIWTEQEMVCHMDPLFAFIKKADTHGFRTKIIDRFGVCS